METEMKKGRGTGRKEERGKGGQKIGGRIKGEGTEWRRGARRKEGREREGKGGRRKEGGGTE